MVNEDLSKWRWCETATDVSWLARQKQDVVPNRSEARGDKANSDQLVEPAMETMAEEHGGASESRDTVP
uniref:Uncharacterized protein n=1 Tax=Sphaerodactylus townsendi TaxID=933632 RepID=A0ACB8EPJ9_9SAUR